LFLRQFTYASVGEYKNFDNIKTQGMYVKIIFKCLGFTSNSVQSTATSFAHQPQKHFSERNVSYSTPQELRVIWTPGNRIMNHRFIEAYSVYNKRIGNQF